MILNSKPVLLLLLAVPLLLAGCQKRPQAKLPAQAQAPAPAEAAPPNPQETVMVEPPVTISPPPEAMPHPVTAEEEPAANGAEPAVAEAGTEGRPPRSRVPRRTVPAPRPRTEQPPETAEAQPPAEEQNPLHFTARIPPQEMVRHRQTTEDLLRQTENNLKRLRLPLSDKQQEIVRQIQNYMQQSRDALAEPDLIRARNLAQKAHLLSKELSQ